MGFKVTELAWPLFKHDCDIAMLKPPFLVFIQNNIVAFPGSSLVPSPLELLIKEDCGGVRGGDRHRIAGSRPAAVWL